MSPDQMYKSIRNELKILMPELAARPFILHGDRGVEIVGYLGPHTFYVANDNRRK